MISTMMAFEGAIFDVDGVLVDSPHELAWREVFRSLIGGDWRDVREHTRWTLGGFTPSTYAYYDFKLKAWTFQGSLGYSVPLKDIGTSLDLNGTIGTVQTDGGDDYSYYSVGVTVPFKLSETAKFNLGVTYTTNNLAGAKDPGLWFTAGLTVGF